MSSIYSSDQHRPSSSPKLPLSLSLLIGLLVVLWIAGGASRADVLGQAVTRAASWSIVIILILLMPRAQFVSQMRHHWRPLAPVVLLLFAATALVALQLVSVPPSLWLELSGRDLLAQAATVSGQEQPWRPLSISPSGTWNALSSLIVPVIILALLFGLKRDDHRWLISVLLGLVGLSSIVALAQFSGVRLGHPLINDIGSVSGLFANRNHFALFAAIGCPLALVWAFRERHGRRWKGPATIALLLFFVLIILATGSRMGILLGAVGIMLGFALVRRPIATELARVPRKVALGVAVATAAALLTPVVLSVTMGRAVSIDRALGMGAEQDLRRLALPTLVDMTGKYFPYGSGFGTFDPAYRIHEPIALLGPSYFNLAHNDLLQTVLDGGLPGLLLLLAAIAWWGWRSFQVWTIGDEDCRLSRLGSVILLLVMIASVIDYPARTPLIMAVVVIAAVWLADPDRAVRSPGAI